MSYTDRHAFFFLDVELCNYNEDCTFNNCCLNCFLKLIIDFASLMEVGISFHTPMLKYENARFLYDVLNLEFTMALRADDFKL